MDLIHDAVKTGHQKSREAEVGIGHRVGETHLNAASLVACGVRDADRGRTVAGRVSQLHRRFKARHQALVGIGRRVCDRV